MTTTQLPQATFTPLDTPVVPAGEIFDNAVSQRIDGDLAAVMRLHHNHEDTPDAEVVLTQIGLEYGTDHTTNMSCHLMLLIDGKQVWSSDLGVTNGHLVPDERAMPKFIDEVRSSVRILSECGMFDAFDPELGARVAP